MFMVRSVIGDASIVVRAGLAALGARGPPDIPRWVLP